MEGEGLLGDQYFPVLPCSEAIYEMIYMPLQVGSEKGSVAFVNEKLGEIWYELNLVAEASAAVRLPIMKCELGKEEKHEIILENPSD